MKSRRWLVFLWLGPVLGVLRLELRAGGSSRRLLRESNDTQDDALRHLSRYERAYREHYGLDLHENWDGIYRNVSESSQRRLKERFGGKFDNYQAIPLVQGYGTHYANLWVGSPIPQRQTVIVDTGSHYTAFPCVGCKSCGGPHHTDPHFDPRKSTTFHQLQCDECRDGVLCTEGQCRFSQLKH